MIAVIVADDGMHFKVVHQDEEGNIVNVTEEYEINPMAITVEDKEIVGFHIGFVKAQPVEANDG